MRRFRPWLVAVVAGHVAIAVLALAMWSIRREGKAAPTVYCGPDGRLTTTAPIQSHRSYCVRAFTPVDRLEPGVATDFSFDIIDDRGMTLREFAPVQGQRMRVIVVRHDLTRFQHLLPAFSAKDGRFTVEELRLPDPGPYRLFADFLPSAVSRAGSWMLPVTISVDLAVGEPASYRSETPTQPERSVGSGDYELSLALPDSILQGQEVRFAFTIRQNGAVVTDLEPYLGANGYAVILREEDLTFLHTQALGDEAESRAGVLSFLVRLQEPGRYRAFVQFRHRGAVRTAAVTFPEVAGGP